MSRPIKLTVLAVVILAAMALTTGAAATSPIIAFGSVHSADGTGIAGASLSLYFAGTPDTQTSPIAQGITDADGSFSLALDNVGQLISYEAQNGGYANLDLVVQSGDLFFVEGLSRSWEGGSWKDEWNSSLPAEDITLATGAPGVATLQSSARPYATCPGPQKILMSTSTAWTDVEEFHAANDTTGFWRYGTSADSNVGVGVSADGAVWSMSGSVHVGNSTGAYVSLNRGPQYGHREQTQFQYGKYKWVSCGGTITSYEIDALQWTGSARDGQDNSSNDHQCSTTYLAWRAIFGHDSNTERISNQSVTFNAAVSVFGASLTAQSGFSQYVILHWDFGSNLRHVICGNDNFYTSSHRVFAGE